MSLVREALLEHKVGCELTVITDGERALQFIKEQDQRRTPIPDLVLLDLNLPRRSGRDVLRAIRQSATLGSVPVVVLTSSDNERDRRETTELGATRYVCKPLGLTEFLSLGILFKSMVNRSGN